MKPMTLAALFSFLALAESSAFAADARPAKPEMKVDVPPYALDTKVFDFPSGLRIMMQSDRSHPVVTVYTMYDYGTKDDPEGKEETAHFVEHAWFRSKHGSLPPIWQVIQDMGASFNATTSNDDTDYRTVTSSEYLPLLLRLESLRLTEPYAGITEAEIDTEREVIRNEWRRRSEQKGTYNMMISYLYEAVYPEGHPYHDFSDHTSIDNIKLADLQKFFDDYYRPDATTIFVVGDFDPNEAASLIFENFDPQVLSKDLKAEDYFLAPKPGITKPDQNNPADWLTGAWDPNSDPSNPEPFHFANRSAARLTEQRPPVPQVGSTEVQYHKAPLDTGIEKAVVIGWSLPGGFRSDHFELIQVGNAASQVVFGGLREEIDNNQLNSDGVGCFAQTEIVNTTVACYAEIKDKELDPIRIRDKMLDQLAELWNPENFTVADSQSVSAINAQVYRMYLTRAKMEGIANMLLTLDLFAIEFGGRAEGITPYAHYTNDPNYYSAGMNQYLAIEPSEIAKIAYDHLKRDRAATVVLEPLAEDEIDVGSEATTYRGASGADNVVYTTDDLKSITPDQIAASYVPPDLSKLQDFKLENGMRVVVLPHGEAPTALATVWLHRDAQSEAPGLMNFIADFTESIGNDALPVAGEPSYFLSPGIPGLTDYTPFAKPFVSYNPYTGALWWAEDGVGMGIRVPSGNVDAALWMLREELETVHPSVDSKPQWMKDERDRMQSLWGSRDWHLQRAVASHMYPNHPAGHTTTWEDLEAMETWGAGTINAWLDAHVQPKNATLLLVGNFDGAEVKKQIETYFGGWRARNAAVPPPQRGVPAPLSDAAPETLVYDEPTRTQSDVTTQCRLNYTDPNEVIAVDVLASMVRSTISQQMRVNEGLAYSPGGTAYVNADGTAELVAFSTGVVNSGAGRMLEFYNEAIAKVESGDINLDEVTKHKLRIARDSGVQSQSMDQMTNVLLDVVRKGKDWDYATRKGELIASVDAAALSKLVQGCREHSITTVVGPKDVLTPQFDERGYTYELVEWKADGDELLWQHDPKAAKKKEKKRQKSEKQSAKQKDEEDGTADAAG